MQPIRSVAVTFILLLGALPAEAARLRLPEASPSAQGQLASLRSEIEQKKIGDAVARYDVLRRLHGSELVQIEDNELISLNTCLDDLDDADQLISEYQKHFDDAAHRMLQSVALDNHSGPADFYAVARRYPLSSAAVPALAAGADRAAAMGDWPTAEAMYQKARLAGWSPDPVHERRIENLAAAEGSAGWLGAIPIDATWYGRADSSAVAKFFPVAAGGVVYVSTSAGVLALKADAGALWTYPRGSVTDDPGARRPFSQFHAGGDAVVDPGNISCAAAVLSTADAARVVVILTPRADKPGHIVQAVRASDGKMLWRTDSAGDDKTLATVEFLPGVTVCGRYVYDLAVSQDGRCLLIALDITTGRELWKSEFPSLAVEASRFCEPAGITVDADQLLICPNAGCVMAVDRWNGEMRWIHPYPSLDAIAAAAGGAGDVGHWGLPPTARFDNHPRVTGATAFFAPEDTQAAFALNSRTGENIWNSNAYADMTLIGTVDQCAIFEGTRIVAVQPGAGNLPDAERWSYSARPEIISGPAVVRGDVMFVPTTDKAAAPVSTSDGRVLMTPPPVRPPNFRAIVNSRGGGDLIPSQTLATFGFPPSQGRPPRW